LTRPLIQVKGLGQGEGVINLSSKLVTKLEAAGYALREPASKGALRRLEAGAGTLPSGLRAFLETTDGLGRQDERDYSGYPVNGVEAMLQPYPSNSLLPLQDDGFGNYDAVLVEPGPAFGAVVFWNHGTTMLESLVASSVPAYLELLTLGSKRSSVDLRTVDAGAARLLDDPRVKALFAREGLVGALLSVVLAPRFRPPHVKLPSPGQPWPPGARAGINPITKQQILLLAHRSPPPPRSS
jgi:cell wall assembly regulator SMI1